MALLNYDELVKDGSIVPLDTGDRPRRFLLKLPESGGIAAGRAEAAEHFADAIDALERRWSRTFRFLPFSHVVVADSVGIPSETAVDSYLAL